MSVREKIHAVMAEVGAIGKTKSADGLNYNFRSIDDVLAKVQPLLVKHKLIYWPDVLDLKIERRDEVKEGEWKGKPYRRESHWTQVFATVRYTVSDAENGDTITVTVVGEGLDNSDKACGKALTYAEKAFLIQLLAIPAQDTSDPDYERPGDNEAGEPVPPPARAPATSYPEPGQPFRQPDAQGGVDWTDVVPASAPGPKPHQQKCLLSIWEHYLETVPPRGVDMKTLCHAIWERWKAWPSSQADCEAVIARLNVGQAA